MTLAVNVNALIKEVNTGSKIHHKTETSRVLFRLHQIIIKAKFVIYFDVLFPRNYYYFYVN